MRHCPKCQVPFEVVRKTFAEVDVCPQCGGVFLDPGEGVATHGPASEGSFLVRDGRAHIVRKSAYHCPSSAHAPTPMDVYAIGFGADAIEIDYCPCCTGCFLDHGEGAALEAIEAVESRSGARFSAPPPIDRQSQAINQAQAEGNRSMFTAFVMDVALSAARGAQKLGEMNRHERQERRWRAKR